MSAPTPQVWLGNSLSGGRVGLRGDDLHGGVCILGRESSELATLAALACCEAGLRTLVVDIDGYATPRISGNLSAYSPSYFLYDAMKMDGANCSFHAQLVASAYSTALNLSFEQEAIMGDVCQRVALEEGVASPIALAERMDSRDAGGSASKRLSGRLDSLSSLSVVGETGVFAGLLAGSSILDLRESMTPEVAELAAALVLAKLLAAARDEARRLPEVVVLVQANRLFKARPVFRQNLRLLSAFVSEPMGRVLSSDVVYGLDDKFLDTSAVRILSSERWNDPRKGMVLAPGMFSLLDAGRGAEVLFVPRRFAYSRGKVVGGSSHPPPGGALALEILDAVSSFGDATRQSLVSYLASGWERNEVERELDQLLGDGCLEATPKRGPKAGPRSALKLTAKGTERLRGGNQVG